jgi:hypothetical protein
MYTIIGTDGQQYGPVTAEQLRVWIREGRVTGETLAQTEVTGVWQQLSTFPEFADILTPAAATAAPAPLPTPAARPSYAAAPAAGQKVPNYLVQAILVTLCCCLPVGIPAIVFAAQVNSKVAAGDLAGAEVASRKAKMWCWIAFGLGIVANIIGFIIGFLQGISQRGGY